MKLIVALSALLLLITGKANATGSCPLVTLDFDTLSAGDYVTNQLKAAFGVTISATSNNGFTPNGAARIFDSAVPTGGDTDLGSPNEVCVGGGPGVGQGGVPGSQYENCEPLNKVLIIQTGKQNENDPPNDNRFGGTITFVFDVPSFIQDLAILDIDENNPVKVKVTTNDNDEMEFTTATTKDNGLLRLSINIGNVKTLVVTFPGSGAIAEVNYTRCDPGVGGDPHFKTWTGDKFSYHGECDLVLAQSAQFGLGQGLDFHIRTTMKDDWSYISDAALKIGNDILELGANGAYYLNGEKGADLPSTIGTIGGFPITYLGNRKEAHKRYQHTFSVDVGHGEVIVIKEHKEWFYISFKRASGNNYEDSVGLTGSFNEGARVGRDGESVFEDKKAFGQEWQVHPETEPMLFQTIRAPQFPVACNMPDASAAQSRRLRGSGVSQFEAEEACAHWGSDIEECVFDVLASSDLDMADVGTF